MADIFLSYSRVDADRAATVAGALEASGRSLWWDRRLASGEDYGQAIEREIAAARCVVVAWSKTARDSLWVRAEANEALDQEKLVQVSFDRAKLPLPFTMLHWLDLSGWSGAREQIPWPHVEARVGKHLGVDTSAGWRPDPGGIPVITEGEPALQGFKGAAALGWAALATATLLAFFIIVKARDIVSANVFGAVSFLALAVSAGLLGACAWLILKTQRASRR